MEMFNIEPSLSPFEQYKKDHQIYVDYCPQHNEYKAGSTMAGCHVFSGVGDTAVTAIEALCFDAPIPTFYEWRMQEGGSNG
jgi:hypothetical protein